VPTVSSIIQTDTQERRKSIIVSDVFVLCATVLAAVIKREWLLDPKRQIRRKKYLYIDQNEPNGKQ